MFISYLKLAFRILWLMLLIFIIWADYSGIGLRVIVSFLLVTTTLLLHENKVIATKMEFYYNEKASITRNMEKK